MDSELKIKKSAKTISEEDLKKIGGGSDTDACSQNDTGGNNITSSCSSD